MKGIANESLFRTQALIGGEWTDADSGKTIEVTNPSTRETIGAVPDMGAAETRRAIGAAAKAFEGWRASTAKQRAQALAEWNRLILANADDLAAMMTTEQGKPLAEAKGEVKYSASFVEWFGEEAKRAYGETVPTHKPGSNILTVREPVGVCAIITPWNFPLAMITRKAAAALAAGCTMVAKPSELTPYCALALGELALQAGIPAGVFSVVTGRPKPIGDEMCSNPTVRKLSFTGSTRTGKLLMRQCADTVKRLSLELGGNAPLIIFDDADAETAAAQAILCKFRNSGQTCVCANRIYVHEDVHDAFLDSFKRRTEALKVGDGFGEGVEQGPLINEAAVEKVERHIADATEKGARLVTGGKRHGLGGTFFEPTILADVPDEAACTDEETFGPVAPVYRFAGEDEVVARANATSAGLAAYFFTRDLGRVMRVSGALEYGMVAINEGILSTEVAPFGGCKESGFGREGSRHGLDEYLQIKYVLAGSPPA